MELVVLVVFILLVIKLLGLTSLDYIDILLGTPIVLIGGFFIIAIILGVWDAFRE